MPHPVLSHPLEKRTPVNTPKFHVYLADLSNFTRPRIVSRCCSWLVVMRPAVVSMKRYRRFSVAFCSSNQRAMSDLALDTGVDGAFGAPGTLGGLGGVAVWSFGEGLCAPVGALCAGVTVDNIAKAATIATILNERMSILLG